MAATNETRPGAGALERADRHSTHQTQPKLAAAPAAGNNWVLNLRKPLWTVFDAAAVIAAIDRECGPILAVDPEYAGPDARITLYRESGTSATGVKLPAPLKILQADRIVPTVDWQDLRRTLIFLVALHRIGCRPVGALNGRNFSEFYDEIAGEVDRVARAQLSKEAEHHAEAKQWASEFFAEFDTEFVRMLAAHLASDTGGVS